MKITFTSFADISPKKFTSLINRNKHLLSIFPFSLMKPVLFIFVLLISSLFCEAKTFRLNFALNSYYTGLAVTGLDYTSSTINALMMAASDGDTVQVYPGGSVNVTVTKRLTWIGVGYLTSGTNGNPDLNVITPSSLGTNFTLQVGSSNSVFVGLDDINVSVPANTTIDNIIIKHCNIDVIQTSSATTTSLATNWQILNSFNVVFYSPTNIFSNLRVENSYFGYSTFYGGSSFASGSTGAIRNCIDGGGISFNNAAFVLENNIINNINAYLACTFNNNVFNKPQGSYLNLTGSNNKFAATSASLYIGGSSQDGQYQLKAGSPAIGAGVGGVDAGIFGGPNPYRLSGIPPTPTIYKLTSSSIQTSGNPYTITFSSRSNN